MQKLVALYFGFQDYFFLSVLLFAGLSPQNSAASSHFFTLLLAIFVLIFRIQIHPQFWDLRQGFNLHIELQQCSRFGSKSVLPPVWSTHCSLYVKISLITDKNIDCPASSYICIFFLYCLVCSLFATVLSRLTCKAALVRLSYLDSPVRYVLFRLSFQAIHSRQFCPGFSIPGILSGLCAECPAVARAAWQSFHRSPVLAVLQRLMN